MSRWPIKLLGEICDINPRSNGAEMLQPDQEVSFVPMAAVDETTGLISVASSSPVAECIKGFTAFQDRDVLFAKITPCMENGKAAIARNLIGGRGFGSTEFHVLRPKTGVLEEWIFAFIRQPAFRDAAKRSFTGSAGQQRVPTDFLRAVPIPVPPLAEQERIVRLLDEAAALCRLRTQADERTEELIASVFTALFGDIESAASKLPKRALGDLCEILSGATPSTENPDFWAGSIPWVSAKDMKRSEIIDAIDHVSEAALQASRLKLLPAGAVLVVVRGMILAHTFPVALSTTPLTINQDLKALICRDELVPLYLQQCLRSFAPRILAAASTAGHGTKRLETETLRKLPIPVPPMKVQQAFAARVAEIRALEAEQAASRSRLDDLFQSLLHRAFSGDL